MKYIYDETFILERKILYIFYFLFDVDYTMRILIHISLICEFSELYYYISF